MSNKEGQQKINPKKVNIKPESIQATLRESQKKYVNCVLDNDITFCHGPAGKSKTFTACYIALKLLAEKKIKTLILCKPIQEAGEKLGFLPGDVHEKIDPYMESYVSNMQKIIGPETTQKLIDAEIIQFKPLAFMRGDTYDNALMILDEAQNSHWKQLILFITRMGKNSKVIVTGDIHQYDIAKDKVSFYKFINLFKHIDGITEHEFTEKDIVRSKILQKVVKVYENWKNKNDL